jgi:hypothetical protein
VGAAELSHAHRRESDRGAGGVCAVAKKSPSTVGIDSVEGGISAPDRKARIIEIEAHIRQLEHEEEGLIEQALAAGIEVHRRYDASPYAVLGLAASWQAAPQPVMEAAE